MALVMLHHCTFSRLPASLPGGGAPNMADPFAPHACRWCGATCLRLTGWTRTTASRCWLPATEGVRCLCVLLLGGDCDWHGLDASHRAT